MKTQAPTLSATATNGGVYITNGLPSGTSAATVTANAAGTGTGAGVLNFIQSTGDLALGGISATGQATFAATNGGISQTSGASPIQAGGLALTAENGIGSSGTPIQSQVASGTITTNVTGTNDGAYIENNGGQVRFDASAVNGPIDIQNNGASIINHLESQGTVTLHVTGAVSAESGTAANVSTSKALTINASSVGESGTPLRVNADNIVIDTTSGGIYLEGLGTNPVMVQSAIATGGNVVISSDSDVDLGTVQAVGNKVDITSVNGSIVDGRNSTQIDNNTPNIKANVASLTGQVGNLVFDVNQLTGDLGSSGGSATKLPVSKITNQSALQVTSQTLSSTTAQAMIITAPTITIKDDNGGTITLASGGSLSLVATQGNIVFLNQNDTIATAKNATYTNSGNLSLTARNPNGPDAQYDGNIVAGNLTTSNGGYITLRADGNITIGRLDAGSKGDIIVSAGEYDGQVASQGAADHEGVIIDGNGSAPNLIGNKVALFANAPTATDATVALNNATSNESKLAAEVDVATSNLTRYQTQLVHAKQALVTAQNSATTSKQELDAINAKVDRLSSQVDKTQAKLDRMQAKVTSAQTTVDGLTAASGVAQAIPFSGDGGAAAALGVASFALELAQQNVDKVANDELGPEQDALTTARLAQATDKSNYHTDSVRLNSALIDRTAKTQAEAVGSEILKKTTIAHDASVLLKVQSNAAYRLVKNGTDGLPEGIDMSAAKPLGVQANRLDIGVAGTTDTPLSQSVDLSSPGSLGLGNIDTTQNISVKNVADNINIVGNVTAGERVSLAAGGSVQGGGNVRVSGRPVFENGTITANSLAMQAANGAGDGSAPAGKSDAIQTNVNNLAIDAGTGGVNIGNQSDSQHPGHSLYVATVDGLTGITADNDMSLSTDGNLYLQQPITDNDLSMPATVTLASTDGSIVDDNGDATNVTVDSFKATAAGSILADLDVAHAGATSTNSGDITLSNFGNITLGVTGLPSNLGLLQTKNGAISITAKAGNSEPGDITVGQLTVGQDGTQALTRKAAGSIYDDNANQATDIQAGDLTLTASGSIGSRNATLAAGLDTEVNTLTASANGPVTITNMGDLQVDALTTTTGDVTLTSTKTSNDSGSLTLGNVSTGGTTAANGNISAYADGSIDGYGSAATNPTNLSGYQLALSAGSGIGDTQGLKAQTSQIVADGGTGGIHLVNSGGDLEVGNVTPNLGLPALTGLVAAGPVDLNNTDGALTINENVAQEDSGTTNPYGDITLSASGDQNINADVSATGGNVAITSQNGAINLASGVAANSKGDLTLSAANGTLTMGDGSTATAKGSITGTAGKTATLTDVEAGSSATLEGDQGITLVPNGLLTAGDDLTLKAPKGGITMGSGSHANAGGDMVYQAGKSIKLTNATSGGGNARFTTTGGDIIATGKGTNVTANNLTLASLGDIGSSSHALNTNVNKASATISGTGSLYLNEKNALTLGQVQIANGNADITTGGNLLVNQVSAANGNAVIKTIGSIDTTPSTAPKGLLQANALTANATQGIDLNTKVGSVTAATTNKDISLTNQGDLNPAVLKAGNGNVDVSTTGSLGIENVVASAGGTVTANAGDTIKAVSPATIQAEHIKLTAQNGIAVDPNKPLNLSDPIVIASTKKGNIDLSTVGPVTWQKIVTGNADINLVTTQGTVTAGQIKTDSGNIVLNVPTGAIVDDGDSTTRISGQQLKLTSKTGLGASNTPLGTNVDQLNATVTGTGGTYIDELNKLTGLVAQASNGDVRVGVEQGDMTVDDVSANATGNTVTLNAPNGHILAGSDGAPANVTASSMALVGKLGIATVNHPLLVAAQDLAANSNQGNIYIGKQLSTPLTIGDVGSVSGITSGGDVGLQTKGNLDTDGPITASGDITLGSGGQVIQNADVQSKTDGNISITGNHGVTQSSGTKTTTGNHGTIQYGGGEGPVNLGGTTSSSDAFSGRTVTITGSNLGSFSGRPGGFDASIINFRVPGISRSLIKQLVNDAPKKVIIRSNGRIIGGIFGRDTRFMSELLSGNPENLLNGLPLSEQQPFSTHHAALIHVPGNAVSPDPAAVPH